MLCRLAAPTPLRVATNELEPPAAVLIETAVLPPVLETEMKALSVAALPPHAVPFSA